MLVSKHILQRLAWALCCLCLPLLTLSQDQLLQGDSTVMVLPDSSNFVTASLLIASPGNQLYAAMGHSSFRMQCPAHHLDYCYSLETDVRAIDFIQFFTGKADACFAAVPSEDFIDYYRKAGRGVKEYELNLTHHEKQRLWKLLDDDMVEGTHRKFNFLLNNCSSSMMIILNYALIDEMLKYDSLPQSMNMLHGERVRYHSRKSPWMQFCMVSLIGTLADEQVELPYRFAPESIVPVLQASRIESSDGSSRPVLLAAKVTVPETLDLSPSPFSPTVVFGTLCVFVLAVTLLEWKFGWHRLAHVTDIILFALQTLVGVFMVYITTVSCLFGLHWNWYLIPFCPLAIVLWLAFRKRKAISTVYLLFTITLIIFLLLTPVSSQLDLPHQLITAALATRTASNYFAKKNSNI